MKVWFPQSESRIERIISRQGKNEAFQKIKSQIDISNCFFAEYALYSDEIGRIFSFCCKD